GGLVHVLGQPAARAEHDGRAPPLPQAQHLGRGAGPLGLGLRLQEQGLVQGDVLGGTAPRPGGAAPPAPNGRPENGNARNPERAPGRARGGRPAPGGVGGAAEPRPPPAAPTPSGPTGPAPSPWRRNWPGWRLSMPPP